MQEIRKTVCNRDCPDACSIVATVEDGRVVRLGGDPDHPITRGFLCYRTSRFLETQYSPERLTAPLLRKGGELTPVSWEEALDTAAEQLLRIRSESGPAAIFHYRSGGSLGMLTGITDAFFARFGPVTVKRGDICSGAGDAAQLTDFGEEDSHDLADLKNARHILLWGKNVFTSSPHTLPVLREAKARGAELALIDPVHHRTASLCGAFYQPRPGGDFALAMAVARVLFDEGWTDPRAADYCDHLDAFRALARSRSVAAWCRDADVPEAAALDLARRLGPEKPTAILVGWGMGRRTSGGAIVRALDALAAVSGNLGIPGGGVSFYFKRRGAFDLSPFQGDRPAPRTVCEPLFGEEVLRMSDPPIRAVWVTAGNPVAMLPDSGAVAEALATRDFVVVADAFLTDTARLAHLVLPTTTLLEADDVIGAYGHHYLGVATPVVPPPDGVKSDLEIMQALAKRAGLGGALDGSARDWKRRVTEPRLAPLGITLETLEREPVRNPLAPEVLFADRKFPTPSGRVNLITEAPAEREDPGADGFPLLLMALSTEKSQCSQWARPQRGPAVVTVHPDAAGGVADGELCRIASRVGAMTVRLRHDPAQRRDVALIPKGGHLRDGRCANALIRARTTDIGEGGALYEERVRVEPLAPDERPAPAP
ncbi:molybdopterin-containing oxidoreductase catalytic subunit [Sorangium cellulosum]|uniref:Molybdopterin-containing oxidoreductase catalytic subunit n=1 Tax=Sorangium cellulosum TaxID=56 RepID=A0A150R2U5_SORCE|nr:molybdopterin-containing oxidoreductase catalytic subunit [Sorangium cellulosum]